MWQSGLSPALAALAAAGLATGCGDRGTQPSSGATTVDKPLVAADGRPVPAGCESAAPDARAATPRGLIVPRGSRLLVESVRTRPDDARVTIVEGYVEETPDDLVMVFERARRIEVIFKESEGFEAEVMLRDRSRQNFWKVVRACAEASRFTAMVLAERVKTPGG